MRVRFLLGPAGSGKTARCVDEIGAELVAAPDGPALLLLAPRQATYQLERQLLSRADIGGFSRLQIMSFARLGQWILDHAPQAGRKPMLDEGGRVMVLRALVHRHHQALQLFSASARQAGFARQLSGVLADLTRCRLTPTKLRDLARASAADAVLMAKLEDLALLLERYWEWLEAGGLRDAGTALEDAARALRAWESAAPGELSIGRVWLDGFALLTPQERELLLALGMRAESVTLAFCLDGEPAAGYPWHSAWAGVAETFLRCRQAFAAVPGASIEVIELAREQPSNRFARSPALQHLEARWHDPAPFPAAQDETLEDAPLRASVRLVECASVDGEAVVAAREILSLVRDRGGRFRDAAVLLRSFEGYANALRRVFGRYEIPFFVDQRESVAHHPAMELTRYAMRLAAFDWAHADWFGALKTGLISADDALIDRLENEALARGWNGAFWAGHQTPEQAEGWILRARERLTHPLRRFISRMRACDQRPTGVELAAAYRELWAALDLRSRLEAWTDESAPASQSGHSTAVHRGILQPIEELWRNLELAFADESLALSAWLPILENGLAGLTVGLLPPAIDQVLIGRVDRSRNPKLKLAIVMGLNEGVFPAAPAAPALLTDAEREHLSVSGVEFGPGRKALLSFERYLGYIALTRPADRLVTTWRVHDETGARLQPSVFVNQLRRLFPSWPVEFEGASADWRAAAHATEIAPLLCAAEPCEPPIPVEVRTLNCFSGVLAQVRRAREAAQSARISADIAAALYGEELQLSASALEDFGACPFKFLASRGLRLQDRIEFEPDARDHGTLLHGVLSEFHARLQRAGRRWREISPGEGRQLIRQIALSAIPRYRDGVLLRTARARHLADLVIESLEDLITTLLEWAPSYPFDPAAAEVGFGLGEDSLPGWHLELENGRKVVLRGRVDRIDLCPGVFESGTGSWVVIIDYKSRERKLDAAKLAAGLDLQLPAYLLAVCRIPAAAKLLAVENLRPAGMFYVGLRPGSGSAPTRGEAAKTDQITAGKAHQHQGRMDAAVLKLFDASGRGRGAQFRFALTKDGRLAARGNDMVPAEQLRALLDDTERFIRRYAERIFAGDTAVDPYRKSTETACDSCDFLPVCRFDPFAQPFRSLRPPEDAAPALDDSAA